MDNVPKDQIVRFFNSVFSLIEVNEKTFWVYSVTALVVILLLVHIILEKSLKIVCFKRMLCCCCRVFSTSNLKNNRNKSLFGKTRKGQEYKNLLTSSKRPNDIDSIDDEDDDDEAISYFTPKKKKKKKKGKKKKGKKRGKKDKIVNDFILIDKEEELIALNSQKDFSKKID